MCLLLLLFFLLLQIITNIKNITNLVLQSQLEFMNNQGTIDIQKSNSTKQEGPRCQPELLTPMEKTLITQRIEKKKTKK